MNNVNQKFFLIFIVIIIILACIGVFFAMNSSLVSSEISSEFSSNSQSDELDSLKTNYTELETKFNNTKQEIYFGSNETKEDGFTSAELELIRADSAIEDVESALKLGKSQKEIDKRIKTAKEKLNMATYAYNNL